MRIFKSISEVNRYYIPKSSKLCSIFIPGDQQDPLIQWSAYLDQEGQGGWSSAGEPQLKLERSVSGRKTFAEKTDPDPLSLKIWIRQSKIFYLQIP